MTASRVEGAAEASAELGPQALLELIGPYVVTTPSDIVTEANHEACELFASSRALLLGKPMHALVPASHRPEFRRELSQLRRTPRTETFVTRFQRCTGIAFDAEVRALPPGTPGWDGPGVVLALRDVTRAVQAEERLRELNAELEQRIAERTAELESMTAELDRRRADLETVVDHIPAGLFIADAESGAVTMSNERGRVIAGAEPGARLLPTREEWSRAHGLRPDGTPYGPDDWPLARALAGQEVVGERATVEQPDGRRKVLEISAAPVRDPHGRVVAAIALFQDVTSADARLRAAAEFVANAAHELRTPLAAIVSGIEVLEAGAKETPAERDRFLNHVGREADRLARLSGALLLLARLQSGVEAARAEIVQLGPVLGSVAAGLRPAAGVRVSVRCASDAAAIASRGLLEQALTSIANNAARYTDEGRITLSASQPNGRVRIRIRDTGRGMRPEVLARAGERFYRGDPTGPAGFGLGLAIARESVEVMGGTLSLTSEVGAGTTADIELPSARLVIAS